MTETATITITITVKGVESTYTMNLRKGWPFSECWKCGGGGYIRGYEHTDNGRCWNCMTRGGDYPACVVKIIDQYKATPGADLAEYKVKAQVAYAKVLRSRELARARADARREEEFAAKSAAAAGERAAYEASVAELFAAHPLAVDATYFFNMTYVPGEQYQGHRDHPLYRQLKGYEFVAYRYEGVGQPLSEKMLEIAAETTAKLIGGGAPALAAGRQKIEGVMGKAKPVDVEAGYQTRTTWKVTVTLDSGQRVYGSIPAAILDAYHADRTDALEDWTVGKRIEFTATVEPSSDDPSFGFYSRPAPKARLVEPAAV